MRKLFVVSLLLLAPSIAWACGNHGVQAGLDLQNWINQNFQGSSTITVSAAGSQTNQGGNSFGGNFDERNVLNGGGSGGWNANTEYWLDISLPGDQGGTFTVRYVAPGNRFQGGSQVESELFKAGKTRIQEWFKTFQPRDTQGDGFVG